MSYWVILCPDCGGEFKVEAEEVPEKCPVCKFEGEFEIVDEEED